MNISRITAIHEAGHAVAAIRTGLVFDHVTAEPDVEQQLDGALHWTDLEASTGAVMSPDLLAIVLLAGAFAEARARGRRIDRVFAGVGATDDREAVASLGLDDAQFIAASRDAWALVDREWTVIERVADELERHGPLEYDEVERIVVGAGS